MKKTSLLLLTSLLTACSSGDSIFTDAFRTVDTNRSDSPTSISETLRDEQLVTTPIEKLPFQLVSFENTNRIDITEQSPIVKLPEGNSFVAALQFPFPVDKFTFNLDSLMGRNVFVPSVLFLDDNFKEVSRIEDVGYTNKKGFIVEKKFDTEQTSSIRYILIFSKDSTFDGKTEIFDVAREYEMKNNNKELSEASYPRPYAKHSPIGNINIIFSNVFLSPASEVAKKEVSKKPVILSDTEAFYLQQISQAIDEGDLTRAKNLTEEAVRAGSTKALPYYMEALENQK